MLTISKAIIFFVLIKTFLIYLISVLFRGYQVFLSRVGYGWLILEKEIDSAETATNKQKIYQYIPLDTANVERVRSKELDCLCHIILTLENGVEIKAKICAKFINNVN